MADWYFNFMLSNYTYLANVLLTCLAIAFFLKPLYRISESRRALLLMLSKEIGTFLMFGILLFDQTSLTFGFCLPWFTYLKWLNDVPFISIRLHLMAMAYNRMHAICFPFNYSKYSKKRFLQKMCIFCWFISLCLTPLNLYVDLNNINSYPLAFFSRRFIDQFSVFFSMAIYLLITIKLLWIKYKVAPAMGQAAEPFMEKDHYKISMACLASLTPFLISIVVLAIIQSMDIYKQSNFVQDLLMTLKVPIYYLAQISEEICLTIICADFRRIVRHQIRAIFGLTLFLVTFGHYKMSESVESEKSDNKVGPTNSTNRISNVERIRQECVVDKK